MAAFDVARYLNDVYQGEVLGEALFALLAERERKAPAAERWRVLERLERHVKHRLQAELEGRGLPAEQDAARVEEGRKGAVTLGAMEPADRMRAFAGALPRYVDDYRKWHEAAPADLKELTAFVLGHEEALLAFAERDMAGEAEKATEPVLEFLAAHGAPEEAPLPEGVQLSALDPTFQEDPYPVYANLRERAPVHRDRQFGQYVLTGHDDVMRVLRDLEFNVDFRKATSDDDMRRLRLEMMEERRAERDMSMLSLDDPEHKRLRNLVSRTFTPRAVATWQPVVERVAAELLDAVDGQGGDEFDLVDAIANPLPAIAIARLLGVDVSKQADFKRWSEASVLGGFNPFSSDEERAAADAATKSLDACFREEIAKRREQPADDLIGKMVAANEDGDELTEQEIVTMANLLLIAGNVTTSDLIGNGVKALMENPDQYTKLCAQPALLPNAIEEMLRFDPPVTASGRLAPYDFELGGVPIKKGESLSTVVAAANRDPAVYPDPDRFDIEREDTHHQSFGGGAHLCLGAHLARLEAKEAIAALCKRYPNLHRSNRPYTWKKVPGFRGLAEYRVAKG